RDLNKAGPALRADAAMPPALSPREVQAAVAEGAVLLDTRHQSVFAAAHPKGAINSSLDGQYASWVGTLVHPEDTLVLVTDPGREEEAVMRLARVGYERIAGTLDGGFAAWQATGLPSGHIDEVWPTLLDGRYRVIDVRRPGEWDSGHLEGAIHV